MTSTDTGPRIGSLCSGYRGLDAAVESVFGGTTAWVSDIDPGACGILAHHWPSVPNHGDMTTIDYTAVEPVDILTAGFPCQGVSLAGLRLGLADIRSGLWAHVARAISELQPRTVVIENVRGLLSQDGHGDVEFCPWCMGDRRGEPVLRALGAVLGDLADLGFDAEWIGLPASAAAVGAPHERWREFIVAWPSAQDPHRAARSERRTAAAGEAQGRGARADAGGRGRVPAPIPADHLNLLPTPAARDWKSGASNLMDRNSRPLNEYAVNMLAGVRSPDAQWIAVDGTDFRPAVRRWEDVLGRPAPEPTEPGTRGNRRLSPRFTEWLMGLADGHVTAVPGLDRNAQLRALGNGVVPQQADAALRLLLGRIHTARPAPALTTT